MISLRFGISKVVLFEAIFAFIELFAVSEPYIRHCVGPSFIIITRTHIAKYAISLWVLFVCISS